MDLRSRVLLFVSSANMFATRLPDPAVIEPVEDDSATLELISQLIAADLEAANSQRAAERLQLSYILTDSQTPATDGTATKQVAPIIAPLEEEDSYAVALRQQLDDAQLGLSEAALGNFAELDVDMARDAIQARQLADQLGAVARKERLDAEFAARLQAFDDQGADIDAPVNQDVEGVFTEDQIKGFMVRYDRWL